MNKYSIKYEDEYLFGVIITLYFILKTYQKGI